MTAQQRSSLWDAVSATRAGIQGGAAHCHCVMAGTAIEMADGSTQPIECFEGGERVRTLTGDARVMAVHRATLGVTRRVIEMKGSYGRSLFISDDHPFWTHFEDDGVQMQWWGTYNFSHYLVDKCSDARATCEIDAQVLRFDVPNTHATVDGWRHVRPIYHAMSPDTPLFHLQVDAGGSYIAEGFVVSSYADDDECLGMRWEVERRDDRFEQFMQRLMPS
ncbi:hypothetical protein [Trinickia fusca]|uniref:hypothetical protein n=1 Tax=Trinickia fusca TaxID=2419777 RepID=UPI0011C3A92E|nr:hypothetical protein [Trinickia fusca]